MLLLVLNLDKDVYALNAEDIVEIIPAVNLKKMPHMPPFIAGVLNYRGSPVPVVDLSSLLYQRFSNQSLSTRIVLVNYFVEVQQKKHILGLQAEGIVDTLHINPKEIQTSGIYDEQAPYLGKLVVTSTQPMMQLIDIKKILPPELQKALFQSN